MPSSKSTLFFLAALAVVGPVAMTQPANALQGMGQPPVRRAEHIQLAHKMVKKRSPPPRVVPIRRQDTPEPGTGSSADPSATPSDILPGLSKPSNTAVSTPANTPTPTTSQQRVTPTSSSASSTSNTAIQSSSTSVASTRSTTTTSTSSSSTQQSLVTSSAPIASSTTLQGSITELSSTQSTGRPSTVLVTTTSVASGSAPQESDKSKDQDASFLPRGVIVGLIVAASCAVGAAIIWTIIRKWKFGASRRFEDRLEPVNWEPPATNGLPTMDEHDPTTVAIARGNSVNSQRARTSFGSSEGTHLGGTANGSVAPDFPPQHDFTAGPMHLAAGAGYADLQRGASPAPTMNYGGYGQQFSTPNPYDAYDYNSGYAAYAGAQQPPHNVVPGPHQF